VARMLAKLNLVSLDLGARATLAQVLSALAERFACSSAELSLDGLISGYTCNINGLDFVRTPIASSIREIKKFSFFLKRGR